MIRRVPDFTLARELIRFRPQFSLDDILIDVVNHISGTMSEQELAGAPTMNWSTKSLPLPS